MLSWLLSVEPLLESIESFGVFNTLNAGTVSQYWIKIVTADTHLDFSRPVN